MFAWVVLGSFEPRMDANGREWMLGLCELCDLERSGCEKEFFYRRSRRLGLLGLRSLGVAGCRFPERSMDFQSVSFFEFLVIFGVNDCDGDA